MKGVDQDQGLAKLLDSDESSSDSDEEEKKKKDEDEDDDDEDGKGKGKKVSEPMLVCLQRGLEDPLIAVLKCCYLHRVKARRAKMVKEAQGLQGQILPLLDSQPLRPEELMMLRRYKLLLCQFLRQTTKLQSLLLKIIIALQ